VIRAYIEQLHTTYGATYLVADSALYRAANLHKLAQTAMQWMTRVPGTLREAQAALAQVDLQALASLQAGYRDHELTSTYGGLVQRWVLIYSERRQPQTQRTVDRPLRQQSDKEVKAWKKLCGTIFAREADARQALATFEQALQATFVGASMVRALRFPAVMGSAPGPTESGSGKGRLPGDCDRAGNENPRDHLSIYLQRKNVTLLMMCLEISQRRDALGATGNSTEGGSEC
jgi:hypothetical protein